MRKVVLDTNVLVSALIAKAGKPARILAHSEHLDLLTSEDILAELRRVLHYPRIQRKYRLDEAIISSFLEHVRAASTLVEAHTLVQVIADDPDDDKFLACAVDGGAAYIVSGDPHLLTVGEYEGIRILSPAAFLDLLEQEETSL